MHNSRTRAVADWPARWTKEMTMTDGIAPKAPVLPAVTLLNPALPNTSNQVSTLVAVAATAIAAARDPRVERVIICTPDKDLAQCVSGNRIVQLNRRTRVTIDEAGVIQKYGVSPASIPDYLGLVGDSADGYPGLAGWGAKSSAAVLAKFIRLEAIPKDCREWQVNAANAGALAATLCEHWDDAILFRTLATLRTDITLFDDVDQLRWNGPTARFDAIAARLDAAVTELRRSTARPPRC